MSIFVPLRCVLCRWRQQQVYSVDLKPKEHDGFLFPREPLYVCRRCLPRYQTDARVRRIIRLLSKFEVTTSETKHESATQASMDALGGNAFASLTNNAHQ